MHFGTTNYRAKRSYMQLTLSRDDELKLYIWDTFVSETVCHGH